MVRMRIDRFGRNHDPIAMAMQSFDAKPNLETLQAAIRAIPPQDDVQRAAIAKALQASDEFAQVRALVITHRGSAIITPLLIVLVFWFTIITGGLNSSRRATARPSRSTSSARCQSRAQSFSSSRWISPLAG